MQQTMKSTKFLTVSTLVKISILSAIGYILMFISVPLPMLFPEFLKIDISDLTALLGGISLGPMAGITIAFLKNLLQFITGMSTTGGVGEFANFLIGGSFVFTVSYIYSAVSDTISSKALLPAVSSPLSVFFVELLPEVLDFHFSEPCSCV